ncbi:hypothetical protein GCM10009535_50570 [Streptomyces thermocarboxydovorans]|uniref:Uncharacterized protein n=1 Tax=Streptomyces thermocarboxydovorans TaxID=59298 RepID=A0ABN1HRV6_9ACTN
MGEHIHVRIWDVTGVGDDGELLESAHCRCGATWNRSYRPDDGSPED